MRVINHCRKMVAVLLSVVTVLAMSGINLAAIDNKEQTTSISAEEGQAPSDSNALAKNQNAIEGQDVTESQDDTKDKNAAEQVVDEVITMPAISPAAGTYDAEQTVTLTCDTEGAAIYYTTDGSEPTEESHLYEEPILIQSSKTIKARAFKENLPSSDILEAQYIINEQINNLDLQSANSKDPELTWVHIDKASVTGPDTIKFSATAQAFGENNHIVYIYLFFINMENYDQCYIPLLSNVDGVFTGEIDISSYEQSATYQLVYVGIGDVYTDIEYCVPALDPDILDRYDYLRIHDDCRVLEDDVSFTVNNPVVDTTGPEVKEVSFITTEVTVPGQVKIEARITDDYSGVDAEFVEAYIWNKEKDKGFDIELTRVSGTENDGTYQGTSAALTQYTSSGTYTVGYMTVMDQLENEQIYTISDYKYREDSDKLLTVGNSCHINNDQSDDEAPKILSVSADKSTVYCSDFLSEINISLNIEEEQSGLEEIMVDISRIGDDQTDIFKRLSFNKIDPARNGTYTFTFQFDKNDAPGTYQIDRVLLSDQNDNHSKYHVSRSDCLPLPNNITFNVINDNYSESPTPSDIESDVEYNEKGQENPDLWGDGMVNWYVPGTSTSNQIGDLNITDIFPRSYFYIPLGTGMNTQVKVGDGGFVTLANLDVKNYFNDTDPFEFKVEKIKHPEMIKEISYVEDKKLSSIKQRSSYLKFGLNDSFATNEVTTTGKITFKALKDGSNSSFNYKAGDSIVINYELTISNKLVHSGDNIQLGERVYMSPRPNQFNSLIWGKSRAALQFLATANPAKFYANLTPRPNQQVLNDYYVEGDEFWFYNFTGRPTIPASSSATLTIGIPWSDGETHPAIANVYIYKVNDNNTLTDVTTQFTYSKDGAIIEGWSTTTNQLGYYMIAGRNLLYAPPSGGGSSGGHSGGGGGGGGGGKGGGGGSGASANLVKAATVTKSATAVVTNSISNALKANLKTTAANIPITAGWEISPATVKSVVNAINAAAKNKGVAITPAMTLTKTSAGKVVSSISFNPLKFTSLKNVQLGVALDDKASRTALSKLYQNNMQMVKFTQAGAFGMDVTVTAKLNLTGMNTKTLQFYTYDRTKKTLTPIATPNYSIDKNGYLHFTTNMGNTVVITDSALQKKA